MDPNAVDGTWLDESPQSPWRLNVVFPAPNEREAVKLANRAMKELAAFSHYPIIEGFFYLADQSIDCDGYFGGSLDFATDELFGPRG